MTKIEKLKAIWRTTHRDFRGKIEGCKVILVLREGGTCLVRLEDLTDEEIERRVK